MHYDFTPTYIHHRQKEEERKRKQQRIDFAMRNEPNSSTTVASDTVTFQKKHYHSMEDALKEVRKSSATIPDTTQVTRPNSKGFHQ